MSEPFLSLGPFQGITDAPFRNVFKRHFGGIDKFYTPFFTGIHKEEHAKNLQGEEIDPKCNDVDTLTPQILSTDAEEVLRFAKQCKQLGYKEINLNMGCPFPRVANKKRGCGLLPYPDMAETMLNRVFEEIDIKFSVKCRLGYFNPEEIEAILPIFNKFPLSELIIHPRIGKQLYKGEADVERFKALIPYINAPLVYNGDIFSVGSFERIRQAVQPVSQFMLGRGILANPFLAEEIRGNTCDALERKERLQAYVIDLYENRLRHAGGSPKVLGRMKELWSYLIYSFEEPQVVWRKIKKINALREYEEAVENIFENPSFSQRFQKNCLFLQTKQLTTDNCKPNNFKLITDKMDGKRLEKVNRLIQKELGDIFQKELKPKVPSLMITVTHVNVTSDLSYARVYLSVFGVDDKKKVVEEVAQNGRAIRGLLGNRVRHQMRVIPELRFFEDDSLDYIENIDNLLHPEK